MHCIFGRCIKCPAVLARGGNITHDYNEVVCKLSDGSLMLVGICQHCTIEPAEFEELTEALRESSRLTGYELKASVVAIEGRNALIDVLKQVQLSRCWKCMDHVGDSYIVTNGRIIHEYCQEEFGKLSETPAGVTLDLRTARPRPKNPSLRAYGKRI